LKRDVTTLVEKNKETLRENKELDRKGRLFDLLIHDLTGPLSIIFTSVNNLLLKGQRYGPLTDQQKRALERTLRNARKAQTVLHEMIEIFRSEAGFFQKEFFSLEEVLKDSLLDALEITVPEIAEELCQRTNEGDFKRHCEAHGIFLEITGHYCSAPFCHDQRKIQQVLRNLMSNAIKHRRKRVAVSIGGEPDLFICVEDDGMGIPQEEQEIIFERFVRLDEKKGIYVPGLGLGLTGVKTLVEAMGGEIGLESHEGSGTRFWVRIPCAQ
jgi:signal transduction histidine kinase